MSRHGPSYSLSSSDVSPRTPPSPKTSFAVLPKSDLPRQATADIKDEIAELARSITLYIHQKNPDIENALERSSLILNEIWGQFRWVWEQKEIVMIGELEGGLGVEGDIMGTMCIEGYWDMLEKDSIPRIGPDNWEALKKLDYMCWGEKVKKENNKKKGRR